MSLAGLNSENKWRIKMKKLAMFMGCVMMAGFAAASVVTIEIDDDVAGGGGTGWTQIDGGAGNYTKDNLVADDGTMMWGVSNKNNVDGMLYNSYETISGSKIQAGTYTLELRVGNGNSFAFSGLNDISTSTNTDQGVAAGFFSTVTTDAEATKNNMYTEFNGVEGVTYSVLADTSPEDGLSAALTADNWVTWTFTWTISENSSVVDGDFYFGVYEKTGGNGSAFFDDSTLTFTAIPEPATIGMLGMGAVALMAFRRHFLG
jgi:hypothetical protein